MQQIARLTLPLAFSLLVSISSGFAQEWTRFRGPNGTGVSSATTVPVKWTAEDYNWKIELPGQGNASPIVWKDRLFITSADDRAGKRYLLCIDTADGSTLWQRDFEFDKYKKHRNNSFATSTPVVDANGIYLLWQSKAKSELIALDHVCSCLRVPSHCFWPALTTAALAGVPGWLCSSP